jgi:hypothetical protein
MVDTKNDSTASAPKKDDAPPRFKVVSSFPTDLGKVLFSTISEKRARAFIMNRFPRGEEAHLVLPDGSTEAFQQERTGPRGEDADQWAPFDAEAWRPPAEQAPPGESAWADVEA